MPELPEVETVVRSLRPVLVGRTIRTVWTSGRPLRMRRKADERALRAFCAGARVRAVSRRAKYILVELSRGQVVSGTLLVHLGMTGRLRVEDTGAPRAKHTHVAWKLSDGGELRFVDPRRFGTVQVTANPADLPELAGLGPDALVELTVESFGRALAKSRAPIKSFLLDQRRLAGLGNIYVSEALHRAHIHPRTPARRVRARAAPLAAAIRRTLELGIANCGTSFRDFVDANGKPGTNFDALLVYDREGEPCLSCGSRIRRQVDAGRATFFCARCQKG
jgi:formamidopyrimidine-DNA glycosylase